MSQVTAVAGDRSNRLATIANTASLSNAIDAGNGTFAKIQTPDTMQGTSLTFQASHDGITFANLYDKDGNEYTVTCATSRAIILPYADFVGIKHLKIRTGTAASPQAQSQATDITVTVAP